MPWTEIIADNNKDSSGKSRRMDKALVMTFRDKHLYFKITCRHHDGHFKYYLDCPQCDLHEYWYAVASVETKHSVKILACDLLETHLDRKIVMAFSGLTEARNLAEQMKLKKAS